MAGHGTEDWQRPWWDAGSWIIAMKLCCWQRAVLCGWNAKRDSLRGEVAAKALIDQERGTT